MAEKTVAERLKEHRAKRSAQSAGTNSVADRLAKHRYERDIASGSLTKDLSSFQSDLKTVGDTWQTTETMEDYKTRASGLIGRLQGYRNYLSAYGAETVASKSQISNIDGMIDSLQQSISGLDSRKKLYEGYLNDKEYQSAKKNYELDEKWSGKLGNYEELSKYLNSTDIKEDQQRGRITGDDVEYMKNHAEALRIQGLDPKAVQAEIEDVDRKIAEFNRNVKTVSQLHSDEIKDLKKRKAQLKLDLQKHNDTLILKEAEENSKDQKFSEMSVFRPTEKSWLFDALEGAVFIDPHDYINATDEEKAQIHRTEAGAPFEKLNYDQLTEDEVARYNYLVNIGEPEKAQAYLTALEETLNSRKARNRFKENYQNNIWEELAFTAEAGLDQFANGMAQVVSDRILPTSSTQMLSSLVREDLSDEWVAPEWMGGFSAASTLYDIGTTTANMAPSILIGAALTSSGVGAPIAGLIASATMGASAGGNAYNEMVKAGYNPEEAKNFGILTGASEAALQYLLGGIGQMGGTAAKAVGSKITSKLGSQAIDKIGKVLKKTAIQIPLNMLSEGGEEYLQEILTPVFKNICFDENNEFKFFTEEALYSGILGALSAGGHSVLTDVPTAILEHRASTKLDDSDFNSELQTNAISKPLNEYSAERQAVLKDFLGSVNQKIKGFVGSVRNGETAFRRIKISDVNERAVKDIKNLLNVDVSGYTHDINTNGIVHILKRHGSNGIHDQTMARDEDIARVGWVLENYDTVEIVEENGEQIYSKEFKGSDNRPSPQIRYIKKIDGTYYVVEAVADNSYKKLWVQSAYLQNNNEDVTQVPDADKVAPEMTADTALPSPSSNPIIPNDGEKVNTKTDYNTRTDSDSFFAEPNLKRDYRIPRGISTKEERIVRKICAALGLEVEFAWLNDPKNPNGFIKGRKVTLNYNATDPIRFVLKHELTHYFETSKHYDRFQTYLFEESAAFKEWLDRCGFDGLPVAIADAKNRYGDIGYTALKTEVVADFVGDMLFNNASLESTITEDFLAELARKDRNLFERLMEWLESLVQQLKGTAVDRDIVKLEQMVKRLKETADPDRLMAEKKHSYAGENARTANLLELKTAKKRLKEGDDPETIRQETGWFQGLDGKWRFEINDRELQILPKMKQEGRFIYEKSRAIGKATSVANASEEVAKAARKAYRELNAANIGETTAAEYVKHDALFAAYPELRDVRIKISDQLDRFGEYHPSENLILIHEWLFGDEAQLHKTLIHELQHVVQCIEGFARGSSNVNWNVRILSGEQVKNERGELVNANDAYLQTAGEIESRDVAERLNKTDAERKETRPDVDRDDVVFWEKDYPMKEKELVKHSIPSDHHYVYQKGKASFTEERVESLFEEHSLGTGKRAEHTNAYVAYLSPEDFLNLTSNQNIRGEVEEEAVILDEEQLRREPQTLFLEYDPDTGAVVNHEGRHRMVALKADGIDQVAVVLKPSTDSFERREPQRIELIGQNFAGGRAIGKVGVARAIPLSEKYRTEILAEFAENPDADVRYSLPRDKNTKRRLTPSDLNDYLNAGGRKNKSKQVAVDAGQKVVLTSDSEITEYIDKAIDKRVANITVTYGKVNNRLAEDVLNYSKGKINVQDNFLELVPSDLQHAYLEHHYAKENGDVDLSRSDFANIPDYLDNYDELIYAIRFKSGNTRICVSKKLTNGRILLIETVSKSRGSIQFKNAIGVSEQKYAKEFKNRYKKNSSNTGGSNNFNISPRDETVSNSIVSQKKHTVNTNYMQYDTKDTKHSIPRNAIGKSREDLKAMIEKGEITLDDAFDSLIDQHGALPKGENPKVDVTFPKKVSKKENVSRYARTVAESGHLDEGMSDAQKRELLNGAMTYQTITDKSAVAKADAEVKKDFAGAVQRWQDIINSGKMMNKRDIALGERLLQQAAENGKASDVIKYIAELSELGTTMGQNIQALSLLKKMTGIGQLYYVQRTVDRLNQDLEQKYNGKKQPVQIDPDLAQMLADSKTTEDTEAIADDMLKDIADQMPSTFLDKWNAWRYLSMLGNPRTHIRNIVGNGIFVPAIRIKDGIAFVGERFISKENRTKVLGLLKPEYRDFAAVDFKEIQEILSGGGKMNPSDQIRDQQKVFKNKLLETLRQKNSALMETEDLLFLKMHYIRALGGALQARGWDVNTISPEQLNEVRLYAVKEAQKATYRDASAVAEALNRFQYSKSKSVRAFGVLMEGVLPFKKTPINILKRGVEYSPIGLLSSLSKGVVELKKGKITAAEFIDGISAGLTGTGLLILGAFLQSLGIVVGGLDYDDEDAMERMAGAQEYSLQIGDSSYTIDWMAPAVLPFLVGAEVGKFFSEDEERSTMAFLVDALAAIGEPMTELSMLSGLNDAIEAVAYSDNKLTDMTMAAGLSYFSQALPTFGGQIARTLDDTRRANYVDKNSDVPSGVQSFYQKALGKIPFAENTKIPYIDAWGRTESNGNVSERAVQNFLSPGYSSKKQADSVNEEIARLYVEVEDAGVIPKTAEKSFKVDGVTKHLTAEEYVTYATEKGQTARRYTEALFAHPMYRSMDDASKADVLKYLYSYAGAKAKSAVSDYDYKASFQYKTVAKLEEVGVDPVDFYLAKVVTSVENADQNGSGTVTKNEYTVALNQTDISQTDKNKILDARYPSKK